MDIYAQRNLDPKLPPKLKGFKKPHVGVSNPEPTYTFNH